MGSLIDIVASALKNQSVSKVSKVAGYVLENRELIKGVAKVVVGDVNMPEAKEASSQIVSEKAEYIGVLGKDVFLADMKDCIGKECDVTMIYLGETERETHPYLFAFFEKTENGSVMGRLCVDDQTEEDIWLRLRDCAGEDDLVLKSRIYIDNVIYYKGNDGKNNIEYEVSVKEAEFLDPNSIESKLANERYFVAGNTINDEGGLSIHIVETGTCYKNDEYCAYIKIEAVNHGEEEEELPYVDFYGDDYLLEEADFSNNLNMQEIILAPGRKARGIYYAKLEHTEYELIEAELFDAIVIVKYSMSD